MWPYPWTHVGTPSHLGHMDRVAATMRFQAHAGAAQEAPDIGQWEGQDVPLVRPSSCFVKGGIPSSRRYLPYLPFAVAMEIWNHECVPFWPNFPFFAIVYHIGTTISPWGTGSSQEEKTNIVAYDQGLKTIEFCICLPMLIPSYSTFGAMHDLPCCTACCFLPDPRVHPLDEQQAASVTASHNPGHGTIGVIKDCESRLGASMLPRFLTLDGRLGRPILPFWHLWTQFGSSPRRGPKRSLRAKYM